MPQELASEFQSSAKKVNTERSTLLDESITNWTNKDFIRVATPYEWLQSNLMPNFFAQASVLSMEVYPLAVDYQYVSPKGGSNFKLAANSVIFDYNSETACAEQYAYTLVSATNVKTPDNRQAQVSSTTVNGRLVGEIKVDGQGYKYICVE